jgi:pyoverdine/dityrosine biosynthesis protein Dit1
MNTPPRVNSPRQPTDASRADATSALILDLLLPLRRQEAAHVHDVPTCFAPQMAQIDRFVRAGEPLLLTLPAFPCKSPNPRKVLGHLPDYGELVALRSLQALCTRIASTYSPGARLLICSDGHVFADLIRVSDQRVTDYTAALRSMIADERLDRIELYTLDDVYADLGYDEKRRLMAETYGQSLESIRNEVKSDERSLALYRGITRFMLEDSLGPAYTGTKSALLRDSRKRAYGVIQRSRAWSHLIDRHIPQSVRLSIHPHDCGTSKFGIRLLDIDDSWLTPWHAVAVQEGDRVVLMKRHAAEEIGHLVAIAGRPSHFVVPRQTRPLPPHQREGQAG